MSQTLAKILVCHLSEISQFSSCSFRTIVWPNLSTYFQQLSHFFLFLLYVRRNILVEANTLDIFWDVVDVVTYLVLDEVYQHYLKLA